MEVYWIELEEGSVIAVAYFSEVEKRRGEYGSSLIEDSFYGLRVKVAIIGVAGAKGAVG